MPGPSFFKDLASASEEASIYFPLGPKSPFFFGLLSPFRIRGDRSFYLLS